MMNYFNGRKVGRQANNKKKERRVFMKSRFEDLTGRKFGRLTVIERAEDHIQPNGKHQIQWLCKCDCGSEVIVRGSNLKNGNTKSCGCLQKEMTSVLNQLHNGSLSVRGLSRSKIYVAWCNMKQRCLNENNRQYKYYGGRGIKVCDEWLEFEQFYCWAMVNGYNDTLTLDRVNVDGNYEPKNCRWVDMKTQQNNTRRNHQITYNGKTQTLAQWSEELNIKYQTLRDRIFRYRWSVERAFEKIGG